MYASTSLERNFMSRTLMFGVYEGHATWAANIHNDSSVVLRPLFCSPKCLGFLVGTLPWIAATVVT